MEADEATVFNKLRPLVLEQYADCPPALLLLATKTVSAAVFTLS